MSRSLICAILSATCVCESARGDGAGVFSGEKKQSNLVSVPPETRDGAISGTVVTPEGVPAVGAQVGIANWTVNVKLNGGKLSYDGGSRKRGPQIIETDASGRFFLPAELKPLVIVVAHEIGYAEVDAPAHQDRSNETSAEPGNQPGKALSKAPELRITLQQWGRAIGIVRMEGKPVAGAKFRLGSLSSSPVRQSPICATHSVETDNEGKFVALRLPPGRAWCRRCISGSDGARDQPLGGLIVRFDVPAGEIVRLDLVSPGMTIVGRIAAPAGLAGKIMWSRASLKIAPRAPREIMRGGMGGRPGGGNNMPGDVWSAYLNADEARACLRDAVPVAEDGSFRIEGLPPADYVMTVRVTGDAVNDVPAPAGEVAPGIFPLRIALPAAAERDRPIDVGVLELANAPPPGENKRSDPGAVQLARPAAPDERAQALAVRAHGALPAIAKLPQFYYRFDDGNGNVDAMHDVEDCTLARLMQAIDGPATVIGIHPAETPAEAVAKVIEDHKLGYPTLLAAKHAPDHFDQRIAGYPVWAFPYCVLVDAQGRVAAHGVLDDPLLAKFKLMRETVEKPASK